MTKTVFGWSDGGSACEYYRLTVPLNHLQDQGLIRRKVGGHFQTVPNPINPSLTPNLPDVVIGQRINKPGPAELWRQMDTGVLGKRPRLVYELDDDLFNVPASNPVHGHFAKRETRETILECMFRADVITTSTIQLAGQVARELWSYGGTAKRVEAIPNALPHIAYRHEPKVMGWQDPVTIGWAGSSTHEEDFDEVVQHLARFLRRNEGVSFHVICQRLFKSITQSVPRDQLLHTPWVRPMEAYYAALDSFDVGIIPLRPSVFNRSKSDLKFLEYAARRIPVIASNCGPYEVHNSVLRSIPATGAEWQRALRQAVAAVTDDSLLPDDDAFDYAWSRRVDTVADQWMAVITGD